MRAYAVTVNLIVKAESPEDAANIAADRLNRWLVEDAGKQPPYPRGSLLLWGFAKERKPGEEDAV